MKLRNLFLSLLAIGFALCSGARNFAQHPVTPPTGAGNSSKPRPRDVSPLTVKRILADLKLPATPVNAISATNVEPTASVTEEKVEPYKTPNIGETTWYLKGETDGKKWAEILSFKADGVFQFETFTTSGNVVTRVGTWRQIGDDIFASIASPSEYSGSSVTATITLGTMKGTWKGGGKEWKFEIQSDDIPSAKGMLRELMGLACNEAASFNRYKTFVHTFPNYPDSFNTPEFFVSQACWENKDSALAIRTLSRIISFRPSADLLSSRAGLYVERREFSNAIHDYTEAIKIKADGRWFWQSRGEAKLAEGKDLDGSISDFTKALELNPKESMWFSKHDYAIALLGIGKARAAKKDLHAALESLSNGIDVQDSAEDLANLLTARSAVYASLGKVEMALADEKRAKDTRATIKPTTTIRIVP